MAFVKRKKHYDLYRGGNPHPTAEELRANEGTHIARIFVNPHPTAEEIAARGTEPTNKNVGQSSSGTHKTHKPRLGKSKRARAHG